MASYSTKRENAYLPSELAEKISAPKAPETPSNPLPPKEEDDCSYVPPTGNTYIPNSPGNQNAASIPRQPDPINQEQQVPRYNEPSTGSRTSAYDAKNEEPAARSASQSAPQTPSTPTECSCMKKSSYSKSTDPSPQEAESPANSTQATTPSEDEAPGDEPTSEIGKTTSLDAEDDIAFSSASAHGPTFVVLVLSVVISVVM
ncbi:hypothetical protein HMI54_009764 [Coelomomyces lativittatus]|nr:hypothetical protein HMI54_009764 [Coelomomyces lativittatus]